MSTITVLQDARAEVLRGGRVKSIHHAEISVINEEDVKIFHNPYTSMHTYLRFSAKPFQATVIFDTQTDSVRRLYCACFLCFYTGNSPYVSAFCHGK